MTLSGYLGPFGFVFIPTLLLRGDPLPQGRGERPFCPPARRDNDISPL